MRLIMLDRIRKILFASEKKQPRQAVVPADSLLDWLKKEERAIYENEKPRLQRLQDELDSLRHALRELLDTLETAELRNKNIPGRVAHIMEGNRASYIASARKLLAKLEFVPQGPNDTMSLAHFEKDMETFSAEVQKNRAVLREFFLTDMTRISDALRRIAQLHSDVIKLMDESGLSGVAKIHEKIEELMQRREAKVKIVKDRSIMQARLKEEKKSLSHTEKKLAELKSSREYAAFSDMRGKLQKLKNERAEHAKRITDIFLTIDSAMRRYAHQSIEEELIADYLKDPVQALFRDEKNRIAKVLESLAKSIESGSLGLKDKKRDKMLSAVLSVDPVKLQNAREELILLARKVRGLEEQLKASPIMHDYNELTYIEMHTRNKIDRITSEIDLADKALAKLDPAAEEEGVCALVMETLNIELSIS